MFSWVRFNSHNAALTIVAFQITMDDLRLGVVEKLNTLRNVTKDPEDNASFKVDRTLLQKVRQ